MLSPPVAQSAVALGGAEVRRNTDGGKCCGNVKCAFYQRRASWSFKFYTCLESECVFCDGESDRLWSCFNISITKLLSKPSLSSLSPLAATALPSSWTISPLHRSTFCYHHYPINITAIPSLLAFRHQPYCYAITIITIPLPTPPPPPPPSPSCSLIADIPSSSVFHNHHQHHSAISLIAITATPSLS